MSYLRGSANYVWCTTSVLGKGATGAVFQGVSKHDGEPVAVKTFNQLSHMRPQEVQVREFEVLKKVKHENIVKLLAIEEEQDGRGKVIVMELCTGGSLFNTLDDPENAYGLQEDEFILVLAHLSAGMKHLRDNNLVHRDLKPGNIMKFVAEDGRIIYKLTDFGAARELEEDGEFMSLYGTEEYLHPDMYERAVLRKPVGKSYSAFVDLWSIGVTLYHVATGSLPFRPYGGRKNKEMMYYIVTKKESGVISGSQTAENGAVEWKRDLPNSCQLSAGIKIFITPLLAGLMEVDPRKRWTFDNFFSAVTTLLKRRKIHIFYVNRIQSLRVYLDLEEHKTLTSFQLLVMEQTDIAPENQILLFKESTLSALLESGKKPSSEIPLTEEETPLILCHRENNNVSLDWDTKDLAKFTTFPNLVNVENDASLAKLICGVGYSYRRRIEKICRSVNLINLAVKTIVQVIVAELVSLHKDSTQVQSVISSLSQQLGMMTQFQKTCQTFITFASLAPAPKSPDGEAESKDKRPNLQEKFDSMCHSVEAQHTEFRSMASHVLTLEQPIKQLHNRFVENRVLMKEWEDAISDVKDISRASIKAATHVTKLRDSWQHLLRDRATRSLTYNDEQFHILERIKMGEKAKCLTDLLTEECQLVIVRLTEVLSDWYKTAQAGFIQTEILGKDLSQFEKNLQSFLLKLNAASELYQSELENLTVDIKHCEHNLKNRTNSNPASLNPGFNHPSEGKTVEKDKKNNCRSTSRKEYTKTFNRGLKELTLVQEEVWNILKENAELVHQFQTLTLSILSPDSHPNQQLDNSAKNLIGKSDSSLSGKSLNE